MAFLLSLVLQRVIAPGCTTTTFSPRKTDGGAYARLDMEVLSNMQGLQRTVSAASQPPRHWQPWISGTIQPVGTLGNKLGVHYFNWNEGRDDGIVRHVWITNTEHQQMRAKIIALDTVKMQDTTLLHEAAQRTQSNYLSEWTHLPTYLDRVKKADGNEYMLFALLTDEGTETDSLIGYAASTAHPTLQKVELSYVETASPFERQNVAKMLSTYALMDAQRRGFAMAYTNNLAGLPGILAYIPAAVNAGFVHVRLIIDSSLDNVFGSRIVMDESDGERLVGVRGYEGNNVEDIFRGIDLPQILEEDGTFVVDDTFSDLPSSMGDVSSMEDGYADRIEVEVELVWEEGEFDAVMRLCFKLLDQFALKGTSCTCTGASKSHCFNIAGTTHDLTFTRS